LKPGTVLLGGEVVGSCGGEKTSSTTPPPHDHTTPKITDFGLALLGDDSTLTQTGAILGTPSYMAPEQAAGGGKSAGPAADVYALGAILYECLTGRPPFHAATALETMALVRTADPVPPSRLQPGVPRDLETIALKCLQKEPAKRYAAAAALAGDLDRFLAGEPVVARPVGRVERAWKWGRRRPTAAALAALAVLAALAGVAGLLAHQARLNRALARIAAEKDRADESYREARTTFRQMLVRFDDPRFADVPRAVELRNAQFEDALKYFARVVERQDDPDPEVRRDVADTRHHAARLQMILGRNAEAVANLRATLAAYAALEAEFPDRPEYAAGRAGTLLTLGSFADGTPLGTPGCPMLEEAAATYERLLRADPANYTYWDGLASSLTTLGACRHNRHESAAAGQLYRRAADLRAGLVRDYPADRHQLLALAKCYLNLSVHTQQGGSLTEATADHDRAEAAFERLLHDDSRHVEAACGLALLRVNWAYVLANQGRPAAALAELDKTVALLEPLHRAEPAHVLIRDALYRTFGAQATMLDRQGRYADAARAYEKVVEYATDGRDMHRLELAQLLARGGAWERAVEVADDLAGRIPAIGAGDWLHRLPRIYALAVAAARKDPRLSPGERTARTTCCAQQAAAVVTQARQLLPAAEWKKYRAALVTDLVTNTDFWPLLWHPAMRDALAEPRAVGNRQ
jgi:tetratricopeptide (TPR) repeat protein